MRGAPRYPYEGYCNLPLEEEEGEHTGYVVLHGGLSEMFQVSLEEGVLLYRLILSIITHKPS